MHVPGIAYPKNYNLPQKQSSSAIYSPSVAEYSFINNINNSKISTSGIYIGLKIYDPIKNQRIYESSLNEIMLLLNSHTNEINYTIYNTRRISL